MISFKNLKKTYGNIIAANNVSFDINDGDVLAIIGPSGCGKTTILRCCNFLENVEEGSLVIDNKEYDLKTINKKDVAQIRNKTAFVFQNYNLFANKTVLQNVMIGLTVGRKMNKKEAEETARFYLEKVNLAHKSDAYPHQLSGGQQQRVAIARALATKPEIIYFDEPTSALDPELTNEVLQVIKSLAQEKMTMVIVTHELNFAKKLSNRTIFIDNGEIIEEGTSQQLFNNPQKERTKEFLQSEIIID